MLVAPMMALLCVLLGLVFGNYYDLPPAQTVVALMSVVLLVTWGLRSMRDAVFSSA